MFDISQDEWIKSNQRKIEILKEIQNIQLELRRIQREMDIEVAKKHNLPLPPSPSSIRPSSRVGNSTAKSSDNIDKSANESEDSHIHMPLPVRTSSLKDKLAPFIKAPSPRSSLCSSNVQGFSPIIKETNAPASSLKTEPSDMKISNVRKHEILTAGAQKFNLSPSKGIKYLADNGYFPMSPPTPTAIAAFLFQAGDTLSKQKIGEYLGGYSPLNLQVLDEFVQLHSFDEQELVPSLRKFLQSFQLPGEAQQIDRIIGKFAQRYVKSTHEKDGIFIDEDTAYLLAFSIVLLNTDLHHPNVRNKISKRAFVKNNLDVLASLKSDDPDGEKIAKAQEYLESIYDSIASSPLAVSSDDDPIRTNPSLFTFFNPVKEGWLHKQGGKFKSWKTRYCIVTGSCLYYFKNEVGLDKSPDSPSGIIPLENLKVREVKENHPVAQALTKYFLFEIFSDSGNRKSIKAAKARPDGTIVEGNHSSYLFACSSEADRLKWMEAIRSQVVMHRQSSR